MIRSSISRFGFCSLAQNHKICNGRLLFSELANRLRGSQLTPFRPMRSLTV